MHKDKDGMPLREGFYMKDVLGGLAVYFTGQYDAGGRAITEGYERVVGYDEQITSGWKPIECPEEFADDLKTVRDVADLNSSWMQRKISQLEQLAKEANLSAQLPQTSAENTSETDLEDDISF